MWISAKVGAVVYEMGCIYIWKKCNSIQTLFPSLGIFFFPESSKELEELRGAFSRSLDYMKQDVEESRWILI